MEYKQQEIKLESTQRQRLPCTKKSDGLDWIKDCAVGKATNSTAVLKDYLLSCTLFSHPIQMVLSPILLYNLGIIGKLGLV